MAISELPDNYLTAKRKLREEYQPQISDINKQMLDLIGYSNYIIVDGDNNVK